LHAGASCVRRSALVTAAAAVATTGMLYHGYLMSEALAYPVFLRVLVLVRAVEKPTLAVPFVVRIADRDARPVPRAAACVPRGRRVLRTGNYRRHLVPVRRHDVLLLAVLVGVRARSASTGKRRTSATIPARSRTGR
jgi:hypothetical protein